MSVSEHLKAAAETISAMIEEGACDGAARVGFDIRTLPPALATWADHVETMEAELAALRAQPARVSWWRRLARASHPLHQHVP